MLLRKVKNRIIYWYTYIVAIILRSGNNKRFYESKKIKGHEMIYSYLSYKYKSYMNNLPKYKHTHEYSNKIWWCWMQGEENAPDLNKACLNSLKKNLKDRDIVIITEDNYKQYTNIPTYIIEKFEKGYMSRTHFSDLLRTELLVEHGGTWIDSSVLCTEYNEDFFDKDLFVFKNWMRGDDSIVCSSWFITSEKQNPILKTTRDLLYRYWKDYNLLLHYFTFHIFFTLSTEKYKNDYKNVNKFSNVPPHVLQFELLENYNEKRFEQIKKMSSLHKLNQKMDFSNCKGNSNYDYIISEYKK